MSRTLAPIIVAIVGESHQAWLVQVFTRTVLDDLLFIYFTSFLMLGNLGNSVYLNTIFYGNKFILKSSYEFKLDFI